MRGYRSGISPMLGASDWFLSGAGILWYIDGSLPRTKVLNISYRITRTLYVNLQFQMLIPHIVSVKCNIIWNTSLQIVRQIFTNQNLNSKMNPISHPDGKTMGCTRKDFEENWPRYNGTALYVSLNWVMVINCSGNGLWPVYWQPIAWLNTNQLVTGLKGTTMKFNKMPRFSRQCIWK